MWILSLFLLLGSSQAIRLERNGYRDVLIGINDEIPESASLLQTLKDAFTQASDYLYRSTKKRAYFDEITIVVPESWSDSDSYSPATAAETFDAAKVRINPAETFFGVASHRAFVSPSTTPCGTEGHYMHITPDRLTERNWVLASPPHRMIVHEWAHLRWGVFDEYFKAFYGLDLDNKPGRCPQKIVPTRDERTGRWKYDQNGAVGSITWKQQINEVTEFCDDGNDPNTKHYRESSTAQNRFCNMQSVWTVMKSTEDFADGANPPREVDSTAPKFRIVRKKNPEAVVLVLDVSRAMTSGNRMTRLRQAAKSYLDTIETGSQVGIVFFRHKVSRRKRLFPLTTKSSRDKAAKSLPTLALARKSPYRKSIAAGIKKGLEMLAESRLGEKQIVVVSADGTESKRPFLNESTFLQLVDGSSVKINTIEIDGENRALSGLALRTGGKTFMDEELRFESSVLDDAFDAIRETSRPLAERQFFTSSGVFAVLRRSSKTEAAYLDPELGLETTFKFAWTPDSIEASSTKIRVRDPSGKEVGDAITCASGYALCTLRIPGTAKSGKWLIIVTNKSSREMTLRYSTTSKKQGENPITLESFINIHDVKYPATPIISASLKKGQLPIIEATVVAAVTRPSGDVLNISMSDNGIGADMIADDGTYTARFTQYSSDGNYNVKIVATADHTINRPVENFINREEWESKRAKIGKPIVREDYDVNDFALMERLPPPTRRFENGIEKTASLFSRTEAAGMFRVVGYEDGVNGIPPGTVTNLVATLKENEVVRLSWTAPGADMENEQADRYDIRIGESFDDVVDRFADRYRLARSDVLSGSNVDSPKMPGSVESIQFRNPINSDVIYIALKTRDQGGLDSLVSNVVKVKFECNCPKRKNPSICKNQIVIYGTVKKSAGSRATLAAGVEYLKMGAGVVGGLGSLGSSWETQLKVYLPKQRPSGNDCDCGDVIREGESYILSATMNLKTFQLEVNRNSYVRKVGANEATRAKKQARNLMRRC